MKKRFLCLFTLFAITAMVFTSCSVKVTEANAKKILVDAIEKTNTAKSFIASSELNISTSLLGQSFETKTTSKTTMANKGSDNLEKLEARIETTTEESFSQSTVSTNSAIYVKDDMMYITSGDEQNKLSFNKEFFNQSDISEQWITADMIETVTFIQTDEEILYDLTLNDDVLSEYVNKTFLEPVISELGEFYSGTPTATLNNISVSAVVKNGYVIKQNMALVVEVSFPVGSITFDMNVSTAYENLNKPITIDFPDFSSYVEAK